MARLNMEAIRRNALPAIAAAVIGVVGWFGLNLLFFGDTGAPVADVIAVPADTAAPMPVAEVPVVYPNVLFSTTNVQAGVMLTAEMVKWVEWRDGLGLFGNAIVDSNVPMEAVVGAVTTSPVTAEAPVTWDAILMPGHPGFVSAVLSPGMLGFTVEVDRATRSANIIYPGDHVDVIWAASDNADMAVSRTVLHDVRVLAVGSKVMSIGRYGTVNVTETGIVEQPSPPPSEHYTLEVTPRDAELLALAATVGSLTLAMRSVADTDPAPRYAAPVRLTEVMPTQPPPEPEPFVRVIRGVAPADEVPA